jgi:hypothetical protein
MPRRPIKLKGLKWFSKFAKERKKVFFYVDIPKYAPSAPYRESTTYAPSHPEIALKKTFMSNSAKIVCIYTQTFFA